jgi:hypothetical protein
MVRASFGASANLCGPRVPCAGCREMGALRVVDDVITMLTVNLLPCRDGLFPGPREKF